MTIDEITSIQSSEIFISRHLQDFLSISKKGKSPDYLIVVRHQKIFYDDILTFGYIHQKHKLIEILNIFTILFPFNQRIGWILSNTFIWRFLLHFYSFPVVYWLVLFQRNKITTKFEMGKKASENFSSKGYLGYLKFEYRLLHLTITYR